MQIEIHGKEKLQEKMTKSNHVKHFFRLHTVYMLTFAIKLMNLPFSCITFPRQLLANIHLLSPAYSEGILLSTYLEKTKTVLSFPHTSAIENKSHSS